MTNRSESWRCGVCRAQKWRRKYDGLIRHGKFGNCVNAVVYECESCGVGFLPDSIGEKPDFYTSANYRHLIGEGVDAEAFFKAHDAEQFIRYPLFDGVPVRNRIVADIGCAAGSFLDTLAGLAATTIGIEPGVHYHESLKQRGHLVFADSASANTEWAGRVDVAVCFSVIEHVSEPVVFLEQIRGLLSPGGRLLLSTPNSRDVLLEVDCDAYRQFFYRSVHAYYFDRDSLNAAVTAAGFSAFTPIYVHRFNFANFVGWLNQHQPSGNAGRSKLGSRFDRIWKAELEETGQADYLYAWVTK
jgi:2-polyprenyl-3-methyl-5-hydroxy-6-metoxy-1,4-benzoquinol methylase